MSDSSKFQIDIIEGRLKDPAHISNENFDKLCKSLQFSKTELIDCLSKKNETAIICKEEDLEEILEIFDRLGISAEAQLAPMIEEQKQETSTNSDNLFGNFKVESIDFNLEETETDKCANSNLPKKENTNFNFDLEDSNISLNEINNEPKKQVKTESKNFEISLNFDENEDDDLLFPDSQSSKNEDSTETTKSNPASNLIQKASSNSNNLNFQNKDNDEKNQTKEQNIKKDSSLELNAEPPKKSEINNDQIFDTFSKESLSENKISETTTQNYEPKIITPFKRADLSSSSQKLSPSQVLLLKRKKQIKISLISGGVVVILAFLSLFIFRGDKNDLNDTYITEAQIKKIVSAEAENIPNTKPASTISENYEGNLNFDGIEIKSFVKISTDSIASASIEIEKKQVEAPTEQEFITKIFEPKFISLRGNSDITEQGETFINTRVFYKQGLENKKMISKLNVLYLKESKSIKISTSNLKNMLEQAQGNFIKITNSSNETNLSLYLEIPLNKVEINEGSNNRSIADLIDSQLKKSDTSPDKKAKKNKPAKKSAE